jgi:hypothetical protein
VDALAELEQLSLTHRQPAWMSQLGDAFYACGNKKATVAALGYLQKREPSLKRSTWLLEELYGLGDRTRFDEQLSFLRENGPKLLVGASAEDKIQSESVLRRLTVQIDGQRQSRPEYAPTFQQVVLAYLGLFEGSELTLKMMEGWCTAEADLSKKMAQLESWINSDKEPASTRAIRLRELRLLAAQEAKAPDAVVKEARALVLASSSDPAKSRVYRYQLARALDQQGEKSEALALYQELAKQTSRPLGSEVWSTESQNLALDILGSQKRWGDLILQLDLWLKAPVLADAAKKEHLDFKKMRSEAQFESAAALGETEASLAQFKDWCVAREFLPKSCDNARVLAVKLKNQAALITVLRATGEQELLAAELEASAKFKEAAELLQAQSAKNPTLAQQLRVALLFELGGELIEAKRVGLQIQRSMRGKNPGDQEAVLFATLSELGLLDAETLGISWTKSYRSQLANRLELMGKGNKLTKSLVLSSDEYPGAAWDPLVLAEVRALKDAQKRVDFYGANGQARFEVRLGQLKRLVKLAEAHGKLAPLGTRREILAILAEAHQELADKIKNSPLPQGLAPETEAQVAASIQELATPFNEKATEYNQLIGSLPADASPVTPSIQVAAMDTSRRQVLMERLAAQPSDREALDGLKTLYGEQGKARAAAYFEGRIRSSL